MKLRRWATRPPAGLTLIELLVVISVLVIATAVLIPSVKFVFEGRQVREASRGINSLLMQLQAEALSGRPTGLWIERDPNNPNFSYQLFKIKSPPPYSGDFANSLVNISGSPGAPMLNFDVAENGNILLLHRQNRLNLSTIQLDYRGIRYELGASTNLVPNTVSVPLIVPAGVTPPPDGDYPYQLFARFERQTSVALELPESTLIHLQFSGLGDDGAQFNSGDPTQPVILLMNEDGSLDRVYYEGQLTDIPNGTVHLLVASDKVDLSSPLDTLTNYWVSIGLNGTVTTTEIADSTGAVDRVLAARSIARERQNTGGG